MNAFTNCRTEYEAEQEQLKKKIEALTAEISEADTETTNVAKLIAVTKK